MSNTSHDLQKGERYTDYIADRALTELCTYRRYMNGEAYERVWAGLNQMPTIQMLTISISYDITCQYLRNLALAQEQAVLDAAKNAGDAGDVESKGEVV